jgi:acetyl esterase/lipase
MTSPRLPTDSQLLSTATPRARRLFGWIAGAALLAGVGSAVAGAGVGVLNFVATLRGHQGPSGLAYGPLDRQRFDIYRPGTSTSESDKASGTPLVIFVYGGTWSMGDRAEYRFAGEALAAQGFTVMVVDYRLYPDVHYPDFLQDCAKAVGYGLEHAAELGADPRRVFVYGHSAGAYNVAMLALDPRWLAAVGHSPNELAGWVGLAGPYNFLPIGDPTTRLVFDWPTTSPDTQPINHVGDLQRPLPAFLGAAVDDKLVDPIDNTETLVGKLRDRGANVTYKTYAHVNHALLVGALAWPLTPFAPVLDDTADFIRATPPVGADAAVRPMASAR